MGMSETCYPDSTDAPPNLLITNAATNPSEATIAKPRGYAATISYLTHRLRTPGFTGDLEGSWRTWWPLTSSLRESSRGVQIVNAIVETARQCKPRTRT